MAKLKTLVCAVGFLLCAGQGVSAAEPRSEDFTKWLQAVELEAAAEGISPSTAQSVLSRVTLDDRVLVLDQKQPENTVTFADYIKRILSADRVAAGRKAFQENEALLSEVSARFGVQPEVIVALWGMESSFGHKSGDYSIVDSLATLAYEGRRADFFRKELISALRILDEQHLPMYTLRGSWAGAMGQCQFMPSTYLHYAVGYQSPHADIWDNTADVFASIANFIVADGWVGTETWGREVTLENSLPDDEVGLAHKHSLTEWSTLGVRTIDGDSLPDRDRPIDASLIAPDGPDGRHFLVYDNFRALMRWNHSTFFATSVGLLADRIKQ